MESPPGTTVDARFSEIASRFEERPALRHRGVITYRQLARRSDEFAAGLKQSPAVIGICLAQPAEAIAAMLGVMKAGRAYTLIDHDARVQRKLAIADEMSIELIMCDAPDGPWLGYSGRWLDPKTLSAESRNCDVGVLRADGAAACCIVQTSGTSGQPLGVEISHAALLHTIDNYTAFARIAPHDRFTMLTSAAHFAAHSAIFGALLNGACLCIFDVRSDGLSAMADWLEQERLTIYQSPPSLFRAFCHQLEAGRQFPAMRLLRLGGEPALLGDFQMFEQHFSTEAQFINALGISEAAGNVAFFRTAEIDGPPGTVLPVGAASPGRDILLLNACGETVAAGEVGEIVVRSEFLATGYYRRPELTAGKFRISAVDGRRELCTGDLGHITPQGWLMHDGRMDDQVKIRGYRVDIGGVESTLCSLPGVHTARVVRYQSAAEADELIAFVVPSDREITAQRISRQLGELTTSPVLPRVIMLDELPLNPGGKVNRARLLELAEAEHQSQSAGPRDETERAVGEIWSSALKLGNIGLHDNFFDSGGNSLQALSVMAAIEARYAIRLTPKLFLDCPTIAQMSEYLRTAKRSPLATSLMVFEGNGDGVPFFFLHNDWKGGFYCGSLASRLGGANPFCAIPPYRSTEQRMVSLQEMASDHLDAIRQQAPQGPYFLGGFCTGGLVAAEMARQLSEQGEKICGLLLIDPPRAYLPWRNLWPLIDRAGDVLQWNLRKKIDCMQLYGLGAVIVWFRKSPSAMIASACRRLGLKTLSKVLMAEPDRPDSDVEISKRDVYAAYVLASRIYEFKRVSVPTTIYLPEGRTPPSRSWIRRMSAMFPSLSFKSIPGNHLTCLTDNSGVLATRMKETLDTLSRAPAARSAASNDGL